MPLRLGRAMATALLITAVAVVGLVLLKDGSGYSVVMEAENAGQLVKGNLVQVGGVKIGEVTDIELGSDNLAQVTLKITDGDFDPLHLGTKAAIRSTSLSAVAGRVVTLEPGPNSGEEIPDGGTIGFEDTQSIVDLDQVLNTLDMQTRTALQSVVHDSATLYAKDNDAANRGLAALNPALSQTEALADQLLNDRRTFEQFIVQSAGVVSAVADRRGDLEGGLVNAARTAQAVAAETQSIDRTLRQAPDTLRRANTTLVNVRGALTDLRPALRDSRAAAPRLARVLKVAAPLMARARPVVRDTNALLPTVLAVLKGLPALDRAARPAFAGTVDAGKGTLPIVAALRYYVPDLFGGLLAGFGGSGGGYYDANGHMVRISLQANTLSGTGLASLLSQPQNGGPGSPLGGLRTGLVRRCPGAATQKTTDGSNPFRPDAVSFCSLADSPR